MRVVVVGSGPVGMFCALVLARRGTSVTLVDRDPGPPADGPWERRGVMQFLHPHGFRWIARQALLAALPDVYEAMIAAGAIAARPEGFPEMATGLQCRRSTFEPPLWSAATREPGVTRLIGHASALTMEAERVAGVVVDDRRIAADLVLVATGRAARIAGDQRPAGFERGCGFSYVSRIYRARPGVVVPRTGMPMGSEYAGYTAIVFPHDADTVSTLLVRRADDSGLARLRDPAAYDAVAPLVPQLAPWVDPERFTPITGVLAGGGLTNSYRPHGPAPVPGVLYVGDAVSTTNPAAGRGVSLGYRQAVTLLDLLAEESDTTAVAAEFDRWCDANILPWVEDHVLWDASLRRRFLGEDPDLDGRVPSDVVCAASAVDPAIAPAAGAYLGMAALPSALDPHRDGVRDLLRGGWRPPVADGPSRDELADVIEQLRQAAA